MAFLRLLVILCLALAVPALIAVVQPASPHLPHPPTARVRFHAHFEEQPLALVAHSDKTLG